MRLILFIIAIIMLIGLLVSIFSTDKLTRFCLYTPLKVLIISLGITALLWAISGYLFDDSVSKTYIEVSKKDLLLYPLFVCFSCAISSYSIFLNKMVAVRNNYLLSFVSFFIIPLALVSIFICLQNESEILFLQTFYYYIAFIIPQSYYYTIFLRKQKKRMWN